jgi:hypothetical protein
MTATARKIGYCDTGIRETMPQNVGPKVLKGKKLVILGRGHSNTTALYQKGKRVRGINLVCNGAELFLRIAE